MGYLRLFLFRYITILYYLNDVEAGGETAFPVADNDTLDMEVTCALLIRQFLQEERNRRQNNKMTTKTGKCLYSFQRKIKNLIILESGDSLNRD